MKTLTKGILLWITFIFTMIYMMAVDSLSNIQLLMGLAIAVTLIYVCTITIKESELDLLLGNKFLDKILK